MCTQSIVSVILIKDSVWLVGNGVDNVVIPSFIKNVQAPYVHCVFIQPTKKSITTMLIKVMKIEYKSTPYRM